MPKVTALLNFIANGLVGTPGMILSEAEVETIDNILEDMKSKGLIHVESEGPFTVTVKEGTFAVSPQMFVEKLEEELPKPSKKKKK